MDVLNICKFFNMTGNPEWFDASIIGKGVIDQGVIYKELERRAIEDSPGGESMCAGIRADDPDPGGQGVVQGHAQRS
jgi:hypothetical protein